MVCVSYFQLTSTLPKDIESEEEEEEEVQFPAMRDYYSEWFNGVDCFNKTFYALRYPHKKLKWTIQGFDDALSLALANSWCLYNHKQKKIKKSFWSKKVAEEIMNSI